MVHLWKLQRQVLRLVMTLQYLYLLQGVHLKVFIKVVVEATRVVVDAEEAVVGISKVLTPLGGMVGLVAEVVVVVRAGVSTTMPQALPPQLPMAPLHQHQRTRLGFAPLI